MFESVAPFQSLAKLHWLARTPAAVTAGHAAAMPVVTRVTSLSLALQRRQASPVSWPPVTV